MDTLDAAIGLFRLGRLRDGVAMCERLLALEPNHAATLSALADMLLSGGEHARAVVWLARITELQPLEPAARRRLGSALLTLGRDEEAVATLGVAIELEPANVRAHNNRGQGLLRLRRVPEAIESFQTALRLDPAYAIAHNNLGLAFAAAGAPARAVECFRQALNLAPALFEAWVGCGCVLAAIDRPEPALQCFTTALELSPHDAPTLLHRAAVLLALQRAEECLTTADSALQAGGDAVRTRQLRAGALRRLGRRSEAVGELEAAVTVDPVNGSAWGDLGTVLHEVGRFSEALAACRRALDLHPEDMQARTRLLARLIPSVPDSSQQVEQSRAAFDAEFAGFMAWLRGRTLSHQDALILAQQQFFYLSYAERSNRATLQAYRHACASRIAAGDTPCNPPGSRVRGTGTARFKLGFVSAHVHDHSVFNAILRGWLQALDAKQFELTLFSIGTRQDDCTQFARASVDRFVGGRRGTTDWIREIRSHDLDALIYPEIGMNETTLALASSRLVHRQYVCWGHPETSGLPTLDGYLSADLLEPPDAQEHYTEPLLRLPNLGVYCEPVKVDPVPPDLDDLGIALDRPLLICAGVPFKYRPEDDGILVEIARRVGDCTFVFFDYEIPELSRRLEARLAAAFARSHLDARRFLRWIAWLPRADFFGLLQRADVYLDTVGFSGFNTLLQAVACGLPCVTYEGRYLRGRLGSGILKRLDLADCIAHTPQEYVGLAARMAEDGAHRQWIRAEIERKRSWLYADRSAVHALSQFLMGT